MTFSIQRRVEFRDTDAAGIVHFSAFFPMMETAEHEMLRSLGISVFPATGTPSPRLTWPRVAASCTYSAAARFEDLLTINVQVAKIGRSSVEFRFRFSRENTPIAEGSMTAVCCQLVEHHPPETATSDPAPPPTAGLKKTPIPDSIRQLLAQHQ